MFSSFVVCRIYLIWLPDWALGVLVFLLPPLIWWLISKLPLWLFQHPKIFRHTETKECGSCKRMVSVSAQAKQQCPHCGVYWSYSREFNYREATEGRDYNAELDRTWVSGVGGVVSFAILACIFCFDVIGTPYVSAELSGKLMYMGEAGRPAVPNLVKTATRLTDRKIDHGASIAGTALLKLDPDWRKNLSHIDRKEVVRKIVDGLESENPIIRGKSAGLLSGPWPWDDIETEITERAVAGLISVLQDQSFENYEARVVSAESLKGLGYRAEPAIPILLKFFVSDDMAVGLERNQVAIALESISSKWREDSSIPGIVLKLIEDLTVQTTFMEREKAAEGLGILGPAASSAVPYLIETLKDESEFVRKAAVDALGDIGEAALISVPDLIQVFESNAKYTDHGVIRSTVKSLDKLAPAWRMKTEFKETRENLIRKLSYEKSEFGIKGIVYSLNAMDPKWMNDGAIKNLIQQLKVRVENRNLEDRGASAYALGVLSPADKSILPVLLKYANDSDKSVRCGALRALGNIKEEEVSILPILKLALNDDDENVQRSAIQTSGDLGVTAEPLIEDLKKISQTGSSKVRKSAKLAIKKIIP